MRRAALALALLAWPGAAPADDQAPSPAAGAQTAAAPEPAEYDEDLDVVPAEPDFHVLTLPTNLRLPKHKLAFRLTHRFARGLGDGSFSDLASDFFGFDGGAQVGLGLRFGVFRGNQLAIYRTSDRTIQISDQQELLRQGGSPIGLSVVASVEGLNNFGLSEPAGETLHEFSPSLALVVSRRFGTRVALYVEPSWVGHTRINPSAPGDEDATVVLGLGARLRLTKAMALVAEVNPRLAGYEGDLGSGDPAALASFGVEWRVGGHAFQINFSNDLGTTPPRSLAAGRGATTGTSASISPASSIDGGRNEGREDPRPSRVHPGRGPGRARAGWRSRSPPAGAATRRARPRRRRRRPPLRLRRLATRPPSSARTTGTTPSSRAHSSRPVPR